MIYLFEIPVIKDDCHIPKLLKADAATAKQFSFLEEADDLRRNFKKIVNPASVNLIKMGDSMIQYQENLERYMKTNVDMMYVLSKTPALPTQFRYATFLNKTGTDYMPSKESNEEACACEIVMVRYGFAFLMFIDAYKNLKYIREKLASSFLNESISKEPYIKEINQALFKFKVGRDPLARLYNVMPDVLKSLVKKKDSLISELKGEIILSVKIILETNANSLYIEQLRLLNEWEKVAKVAKGTHNKLTVAYKNFFNEGNSLKQELFEYCEIAMKFFYGYALWAVFKLNQVDMKAENYTKKSFIVLSRENVNISKELMQIYSEFKKRKTDADYYDYALYYAANIWLPEAEHTQKVFSGIGTDKTDVAEAPRIFSEILETVDYFE